MRGKMELPGQKAARRVDVRAAAGWILMGISFVMLLESIRLCFSSDIWYDELFTMGMAQHSYGEFIRFTAKDVHPPLYYIIVKLILDLCKLIWPSADDIIIVKLVSVLPYFLLLIYALTFLKKRFGMFTAGLFYFCIMAMPQMSAYTVEMRMYSWALFFVTAAYFHGFAIVSMQEPGKEIPDGRVLIHYTALVLYGLAAAYTQYFACVAVVMVYLYLFVWFLLRKSGKLHPLRSWCVCVAVSVLGYLPWLFVLISQITTVRANYWILPLTWRSLGGCVKFLMKPAFTNDVVNVILAVVMFLIYVGFLAGYAWQVRCSYRAREAEWTKFRKEALLFFHAFAGCMVLCGLTAFGFIASFVIRPIFVYRYMLPAMGCFWFCFAASVNAILSGTPGEKEDGRNAGFARFPASQRVPHMQTVLAAAAVVLIAIVGIRGYRAFLGEEEYKAVLMRDTQQVISDIAKDDIILYNFDQLQAVAGYYMPQESYLWNGEAEPLIEEIFGQKGTVTDTVQIASWLEEGKKVWFFGSFNSRENVRQEWEQDGLMTTQMQSCLLERYWFNVYSVTKQ